MFRPRKLSSQLGKSITTIHRIMEASYEQKATWCSINLFLLRMHSYMIDLTIEKMCLGKLATGNEVINTETMLISAIDGFTKPNCSSLSGCLQRRRDTPA